MPFNAADLQSFLALLASAVLYEASSFSTAASRSFKPSTSASSPPTAPASLAILRLRLLARLDSSPVPSSSAFCAAAAGCPDAGAGGGVGLDVVAAEEVVAVEVEGVAVFAPEKAAVLAVVVVPEKATVLVDAEVVADAVVPGVETGSGLDKAAGLIPGEGPGRVPLEEVGVRAGLPEGTNNLSFPPSELPPGVLRKGQSSHLTFLVDHLQVSPLAGSVAWRVNQKTSPWTAVSWERVLGLYSPTGMTFFSAKISRTVSSLGFGVKAANVAAGVGPSWARPSKYFLLPSGAPRRRYLSSVEMVSSSSGIPV